MQAIERNQITTRKPLIEAALNMKLDAKNNSYLASLEFVEGVIEEADDAAAPSSALQTANAPKWIEIGKMLITAFVKQIARSEQTKRSYSNSAKHVFAYLDSIRAPRCSSLEVAGFYQDLKSKVNAGAFKASTMQAYMQAAERVIEWGREHAQEADDIEGMTAASEVFKALFPGKPFSNKPKTETFKGHKRSGLTVTETDAFLNFFEAGVASAASSASASLEQKARVARRNRCMMYLMNELGLRCCEIVRLHLHDVQVEGRNVRIGITHKGKTTPCPKYIDKDFMTARYLLEWKAERVELDEAATADFLFVSLSNRGGASAKKKSLTTRTVENVCVDALKSIGVKCDMITTHSIRHSFATQALEAVPTAERMQAAREIQDTMGHSSLDITLTNYAHDIDSKESRIRHIREQQRLERMKEASAPTEEKRGRGRPKGSKNKTSASAKKSRKTKGK